MIHDDPQLGIYFYRVSDPYSVVLCSEEYQTKMLCCKKFAFFKAIIIFYDLLILV